MSKQVNAIIILLAASGRFTERNLCRLVYFVDVLFAMKHERTIVSGGFVSTPSGIIIKGNPVARMLMRKTLMKIRHGNERVVVPVMGKCDLAAVRSVLDDELLEVVSEVIQYYAEMDNTVLEDAFFVPRIAA